LLLEDVVIFKKVKIFFKIYIGAMQPSYVVTADDVDTLLAIEVQPLDDKKRKVLMDP
jgi:hypothetical protein